MESLFAITGNGFVLMATDTENARSIFVLKHDQDKIFVINNSKILSCVGEEADRAQFCDYVQKNIHLYSYRTGIELSASAAAHWIRGELASSLRSSQPYLCNMAFAGYDEKLGVSLYFLDYLASMHKVPFCAHGYASSFLYGILDKYHREDLTRDEAHALANQCMQEIIKRFIVTPPNFTLKILDKDGVSVWNKEEKKWLNI